LSSFPVLISEDQIKEKISHLAHKLSIELRGKKIVLLIIMKGALCFAADFIRNLSIDVTLEYLSCKSYGMKGTVSEGVEISGLSELELQGKTVLLLDDIFDTGKTVEKVVTEIKKKNPVEIKTIFLLAKQKDRAVSIKPDYALFEIPDLFVVGYGMDYKEQYRGLKEIRYLP
jgi:hypoxanthine phosphoribosyltransferase